MNTAVLFLNEAELIDLTGRKTKRRQVEALRMMRIPFFVNAIGAPVVCRVALTGAHAPANEQTDDWSPSLG